MTKKTTAAVMALSAVLLLPGGALGKRAPDPAKVQRKLDAALAGEKELIRATVADAERADRLIALLEERDRLVAEHVDLVAAYRTQMRELNADYRATRESFTEAVDDYNNARAKWQQDFVQLIDKMKKQTTAAEWKAIAKYQLKKLNPRELAYKQPGGGD